MITNESDSGLPLLSKCIGSAVLPRHQNLSNPATIGQAIHAHMEMRAKIGPQEARECVRETVAQFNLSETENDIAIARCMSFTWNPPPGSLAEVALAWDVTSPELPMVVQVQGGAGSYDTPEDVGAPGTVDLLFAEPYPIELIDGRYRCPPQSALWVCDYKTGSETWVDNIEHNKQLAAAAAKAAFWLGARKVIPAVISISRGEGTWDVVDEPWNENRVIQEQREVLALHRRMFEAKGSYATLGIVPPLVEGYHCRWCRSMTSCPAKISATRAFLATTTPEVSTLTSDQARQLIEAKLVAQDMLAKVTDLLKTYVDINGPIPLENGRFWGTVSAPKDVLMPDVWLPLLQEVLGPEAALGAVTITKTAVNDTVKELHRQQGIKRQKAAVMRSLLSRAGQMGGIMVNETKEYRIFKKDEDSNDK